MQFDGIKMPWDIHCMYSLVCYCILYRIELNNNSSLAASAFANLISFEMHQQDAYCQRDSLLSASNSAYLPLSRPFTVSTVFPHRKGNVCLHSNHEKHEMKLYFFRLMVK